MISTRRDEVIARIHKLRENGTAEEILASLDNLIEIDGETINLLDYRFYLLGQLGQLENALAVAEKMEAVADRKSPWNLLRIGEGLIALGRTEEAYQWIDRAIDERRFRRVSAFTQPAYDPIRSDERFSELVDRTTANIGLAREADDFSLRLLDGTTVALSNFRGSVVLLDFWSVDCPPCVQEIPVMRTLYDLFHDDGFEILGISMDEDAERVRTFIHENDVVWPMACSSRGWKDEVSVLYDVQAQPSIWLIDQQGILRFFDVRGGALEGAVRELLTE